MSNLVKLKFQNQLGTLNFELETYTIAKISDSFMIK